jgi:quinoprotein glucose dehydrogenase
MTTRFGLLAVCTLLLGACQPPREGDAGASVDRWAGWSSYAGTSDSAQYSSLDQINRDNVGHLEIAWTYPTGETSHRCSPIVVGQVMYVVANGGVTALDAATGAQQWFAPDSASPNVRGLVYWQDEQGTDRRVLVVKDHYLQALDADNGEIIPSFGAAGRVDLREGLGRDPESIPRIATMTPGRIFEDLIIVGSAMGDDAYEAAPGDIRAYDVRSGAPVWTFHTVPHPGEVGYETWPPEAWKTVGAANAWTNMAVDEARGIVYVPTGAPSYHFHGANRQGDNLFANSLIALDARTGERLWHFQAIHHDLWDWDIAMGPKLLTVEREGRRIDAVALAGKHGFLFVFDRVTGEPVFPIEERAVPASDVPGEHAAPTQPFPVDLPPFARQTLSADDLSPYADPAERAALAARIRRARDEGLFTPPSFYGSVSAPGSRGGAQHGNGAVIPEAGLFYLAVVESPTLPLLEIRRDPELDAANAGPAEIYGAICASCHGPGGRGQPPLFPALIGIKGRLSESDFASVVHQGRGRMSGYPDIPEARLAALMDYVDRLDSAAPAGERPATSPANAGEVRYRSGYHHFFTDVGLLGPLPWSRLVAYDLNAGTILWDRPYGDVPELAEQGITGTGSLFPTNSLTATAGGLLFSTTNDRRIRARDRDTGEVLWSAELPADPGGIPAVYEIDGREFVVATATRSRPADDGAPPPPHAYVAFALPRPGE